MRGRGGPRDGVVLKLNLILIAGLALGSSSLASAQAPSLDARVSLDIVEQPLSEVVKYLRDRSGANVVILDGSGDKLVRDLDIQDVDWRDALDYACQMASCVVTEDRSGVLTITDPPAGRLRLRGGPRDRGDLPHDRQGRRGQHPRQPRGDRNPAGAPEGRPVA